MSTEPIDQPDETPLSVRYAPDDIAVGENPPRFTWLPAAGDAARYVLRILADPAAGSADHVFADIPHTFFTPDICLPPGRYQWSYALWCPVEKRRLSDWSRARSFEVAEDAVRSPLPSRADRYKGAARSFPRLWLDADALAAFRAAVAGDPTHCQWDRFHEASVVPWLERPVMAEPKGYPQDVRVPEIWRETYIGCQEAIYAIRHLAVAGHVTGNEAMRMRARDWLLAIAEWDPDGVTSRDYADEWAFRIAIAMAWGYDWLKDDLDGDARDRVRGVLAQRAGQIADHVMRKSAVHLRPFDSHAVRAIPSVLVPAGIALFDEVPEAREWLDYAIDYLATLYSPWADADGGYAEGPHYWMTGLATFIEAANLLCGYIGLDLFQRRFLRRTGEFPFYMRGADTRRCSFGDDSALGGPAGLKMAQNMRQLASVTGRAEYQWYSDTVAAKAQGTEHEFHNYGWWDLNFDTMVFLQRHGRISGTPPPPDPVLKAFRGTGWAALHARMDDPSEHIQMVFKSSPFGSISHSHADQNAFCLAAFGEDLAIQSGQYVAFNSDMHLNWRRQTRSKNAVLIDGCGQYAGRDKRDCIAAAGRILRADRHKGHAMVCGDATEAYRQTVPHVRLVQRQVHFLGGRFFIVVDRIEADRAVEVDWLLHTEARVTLGHDGFRCEGARAGLSGRLLLSGAGPATITVVEGFPGIDPSEIEPGPVNRCVTMRFPKAHRHIVATALVPYKGTGAEGCKVTLQGVENGNLLDIVGPDGAAYVIDCTGDRFDLRRPDRARACRL